MKSALIALAWLSAAMVAFGQGKIIFVNDAASPIVLGNAVLPADTAVAGQPVNNPLPSGISLVAGLYGGTSSSSLVILSVVPVSAGGNIPATTVPLIGGIPAIASGTPINANTPWFQVRVWDSAFASYESATSGGNDYSGAGALFQMNTLNVRTAPPSLDSTWHDAPIVASVPEPSAAALAALAAAGFLVAGRKRV